MRGQVRTTSNVGLSHIAQFGFSMHLATAVCAFGQVALSICLSSKRQASSSAVVRRLMSKKREDARIIMLLILGFDVVHLVRCGHNEQVSCTIKIIWLQLLLLEHPHSTGSHLYLTKLLCLTAVDSSHVLCQPCTLTMLHMYSATAPLL